MAARKIDTLEKAKLVINALTKELTSLKEKHDRLKETTAIQVALAKRKRKE
jgi:hypothetical protein